MNGGIEALIWTVEGSDEEGDKDEEPISSIKRITCNHFILLPLGTSGNDSFPHNETDLWEACRILTVPFYISLPLHVLIKLHFTARQY